MSDPAPAQAATPGHAFREALHERWAARGRCTDNRPWDALPEVDREDLDFAAAAAIRAHAAPPLIIKFDGKLTPELLEEIRGKLADALKPRDVAADLGDLRVQLDEARAERDNATYERDRLEGQLEDARAECGQLREALREALRHIEPVDQNSELAIAGWRQLAEAAPATASPAAAQWPDRGAAENAL